jgi:peptidoglycan/LPS O-acetylase OafA/YrhL
MPKDVRSFSTDSRNQLLDAWRGLACVLVYCYHTGFNFAFLGAKIWGFTGVHLFFVLSGYLISRPFVKAISSNDAFPSVQDYLARRFYRIYPPYFVCLLLFILLRYFTKTKPPSLLNILSHFALVFNYDVREFFSINPVFWSLAIEIQFYILLPLFFWFAFRSNLGNRGKLYSVVFAFLAIGLMARSYEFFAVTQHLDLGLYGIPYFYSIFSFLDLFGFGILVAVLEKEPSFSRFLKERFNSTVVFLGGLIAFFVTNHYCTLVSKGEWMGVKDVAFTILFPFVLCFSIACMLLSLLAFSDAVPTEIIRYISPLTYLGKISFSLYLYHVGVQFAIQRLFLGRLGIDDYGTLAVVFALAAALPTILVATTMFYFVEQPSMNRAKRSRVVTQMSR